VKVHKDFGVSFVAIQFGNDWNHYIEAHKDVRQPFHSFIEVVRGGQVRERRIVSNEFAPEVIIKLMRRESFREAYTKRFPGTQPVAEM
jgi:hypothetical protein